MIRAGTLPAGGARSQDRSASRLRAESGFIDRTGNQFGFQARMTAIRIYSAVLTTGPPCDLDGATFANQPARLRIALNATLGAHDFAAA